MALSSWTGLGFRLIGRKRGNCLRGQLLQLPARHPHILKSFFIVNINNRPGGFSSFISPLEFSPGRHETGSGPESVRQLSENDKAHPSRKVVLGWDPQGFASFFSVSNWAAITAMLPPNQPDGYPDPEYPRKSLEQRIMSAPQDQRSIMSATTGLRYSWLVRRVTG